MRFSECIIAGIGALCVLLTGCVNLDQMQQPWCSVTMGLLGGVTGILVNTAAHDGYLFDHSHHTDEAVLAGGLGASAGALLGHWACGNHGADASDYE